MRHSVGKEGGWETALEGNLLTPTKQQNCTRLSESPFIKSNKLLLLGPSETLGRKLVIHSNNTFDGYS